MSKIEGTLIVDEINTSNSKLSRMLFMAAKVALVVGSVLLVINQYDALFADANLKVLPAILTYCVPFCVFLAGQKIKV
ncbi:MULTISPECIES: nitrate/nitrite transporter NrtS [unclassified Pseudoalteromonas]|jgi:methyl-accepting chemotaxis protein|uniref:nitrate/nitrite transporter NrtS n=1 Tax=unclassified Pseudoalteromonas TaxID=194690 RepID=UPI000413097B|nr:MULTISPECIES: nitrate/nitrite transporter NrtS [unclassified Pseudoalteromonas]